MGLIRSVSGLLRIELTSAALPDLLRYITERQIPIYNLCITDDLTAEFTITRRNLKQIQSIAQRKGSRVRILSQLGVFWKIMLFRKRPVLITGIILILTLALFLPSLVLFVEVEGNEMIPEQLILEAAEKAGVGFGVSRRAVRSERVKNELLAEVPQLQWAGVNTYGCRAVISVRERMTEVKTQAQYLCSNIVASEDGVINAVTVTKGTGLCVTGQAVKKGQVLISGYTDCGGVILAVRASGEIFAQTRHEMTVVTPSESEFRMEYDCVKTKYCLCIGKKRINFYKGSGISDGSCVKMVSQYYLTLPGGYQLPLSLIKEEYTSCEVQIRQVDAAQARPWLAETSKALLQNEGISCSIVDAKENFVAEKGMIKLSGTYSCTEMIGREKGEQTGDFHGKTD